MLHAVAELEVEGDEREEPAGEVDPGRVLTLSDGVFAIAATLLALELRIPAGLTESGLADALHHLLPTVGAYALSYLVIGLLWLGHHRQFQTFEQISERVARLNLVLLGLVATLPFATSLLANYGSRPIATQLYAGVVGTIFCLQLAMAQVARRRHHLTDAAASRPLRLRSLALAVVFLASIPVAAVSPAAGKYFWLLLAVWGVARQLIRRMRPRLPKPAG